MAFKINWDNIFSNIGDAATGLWEDATGITAANISNENTAAGLDTASDIIADSSATAKDALQEGYTLSLIHI